METTTTRKANNNENNESKLIESIEQAEIRRQRERDRAAWRRQNETPDQTLKRREKERERAARRRRNEDPIQTALRLQRDRERAARRRRNEHPEETLIRLKRERERTAERRRIRKAILPSSSSSSCSEKDGLFTNSNNTTTTTTQQEFLLQFTKKDEEKMMAPFIQNESYQEKCSPIIGDNSAASSSLPFCSSPVRDISSNLSTDDNNLLSSELRPQFLSVLSKHHCMLMTNLATFWKSGQYCDAAIEAENCKILVHKLLLLAISPRLQCEVQVPIISFLTVKFSQAVNQAGLNAFADYLYNGILSLDLSLLLQLQIMAKQLGIKELELLCENQLGSSDTQPNVQQTDSLLAASSTSDVSISFAEGNFNIKKESFMDESSDYCTDSASELVSINQTFPSEKAINPINHIHHDEEDNLLSNHIPHFQETENHFEKKHLTLSSQTSALFNETEMKDFGNFVQNSNRIELKTSNLNSYPPKAQNLCPIDQGSIRNSSLIL